MDHLDFTPIVTSGFTDYMSLARHQLDSYNKFIDQLPSVIETEFKQSQTITYPEAKKGIKSVEFKIKYENVNMDQSYTLKNGEKIPIYPSHARNSNRTYELSLIADPICVLTYYKELPNGQIEKMPKIKQRIPSALLGTIPQPVGNKKCHLFGQPDSFKVELGENPIDIGGYYIIDGSEKDIVSYKNVAKNIPQIHKLNKHKDNLSVKLDFTSKFGDNYEKSTYMVLGLTTGNYLYAIITLGKDLNLHVPFFVLYYLFGMIQDKKIMQTIISNQNPNSSKHTDITKIMRTALTGNYSNEKKSHIKKAYIKDYRLAEYFDQFGRPITDLSKIILLIARVINENDKGVTSEKYNVDTKKDEELKVIFTKIMNRFDKSLFPHIGITEQYRENKLQFLGSLIRDICGVQLGDEPTDRNSYRNIVCNNANQGLIGSLKAVFNITIMNPLMKAVSNQLKNLPEIDFSQIYSGVVSATKLGENLCKALKAGNKDKITINKKTEIKNRLITVQHERVNQASLYHALNGITPDPNGIGGKAGDSNLAARMVHPTQPGVVCPIQSVEGERAGQSGQLTPIVKFADIIETEEIKKLLRLDVQPSNMIINQNYGMVYVNSDLIGSHHNTKALSFKYKELRRKGIIDRWVTIDYRPGEEQTLHFLTMQGRLLRPFVIIYNNEKEWLAGKAPFKQWITYTQQHSKDLASGKLQLSDLEAQEVIEYISPMEYRNIYVCPTYTTFKTKLDDYKNPYTHLDIPIGNFCIGALTGVFGNHSDIVRTLYQTKLSKQAISNPAGNYHNACFAKMPLAYNAYDPIVLTIANKLIQTGGANWFAGIIVTSENQEDSVTIRNRVSQSAKFSCNLYTPISVELDNGQTVDTPQIGVVQGLKCRSYSHLIKGYPKPGTIITRDMPILGIIKTNNEGQKVDESIVHKKDKSVIVDSVSVETNSKAATVIKIKMYDIRHVEEGDKFASRGGNKGIISKKYNDEEFVILESGIIIEANISCHAFPTRMTVNQIMEGEKSEASLALGVFSDATMFNDAASSDLDELLAKHNVKVSGMKNAYNGRTGEKLRGKVFVVPMYYQRLTKMVAEVSNVVNNPSIDIRTNQPNKGVGTGGGIRFGEMEKDAAIAHGSINFIQYKMLDKCDAKIIFICDICHKTAIANQKSEIYYCPTCPNMTLTRIQTTTSAIAKENYEAALGISCEKHIELPMF